MPLTEEKLNKLDRLLSLLDAENTLTKEDFLKSFEKVLEVVVKIQKEQQTAIEKLEEAYKVLIERNKLDYDSNFKSLKGQVNSLFVDDQLKRIYNDTKGSFRALQDRLLIELKNKFNDIDLKVANIKPPKGDRGDPGLPGKVPTTKEFSLLIESLLKTYIKSLETKVRETLSGRRLGSGQSVIVPRRLVGISSDTTPPLSGAINGTNTDFTMPKAPRYLGDGRYEVEVFQNGVRRRQGSGNDYTVAGRVLTFNSAPLADDIIIVDITY